MSFSRWLLCTLLAISGVQQVLAQGIAWEHADPVPQSAGSRATLFGYPFPYAFEDPGFSPHAVVPRVDGAYVVLPVNGISRGAELGFVLNPSWQRLRGFQIVRLDLSGQVVWKRFWNFGGASNDFVSVFATELNEARLTPSGGLAIRVGDGGALFLDAAGNAQRVSTSELPSACYPSNLFPSIERAWLSADGHFVVTIFAGNGLPARACALDASGQLVEMVEAPTGRDHLVFDFWPGAGFLMLTRPANSPTLPWQDTRLRQGGVDRWQIDTALSGGEGFALSATGDAWLHDGSGTLRVIGIDGGTRTQIADASGLDVRAWLGDGDALLATSDIADVRRLSPDGVERWRVTRASTSSGLGEWRVLGDKARLLASQLDDGDGEVFTVDLTSGETQVGAEFTLGDLAAGPLGPSRQMSVSSGEPEATWLRDLSTCLNQACAPFGVSFSSTMDVRVFESTDGAALAGPPGTAFDFPTYARLRETSPAVVLDSSTFDVAHARYVSNGEKELLEVTRLSERGQVRWRRVLEVPRFDISDAQLAFVNGVLYVAASSRGPLASAHRLWALDAQGQIAWERTLDEPFKQLTRVTSANGASLLLCGLGFTQRNGGPWQAPKWRCYDAAGTTQVDTVLTQVLTSLDVTISHVLGTRVFLRVLNAADVSSTGVTLIAINANGATMPGGVTWVFEPLGTGEFVRVDAVTRRAINLVTAPVLANAAAIRPNALLVAAFDSAGTRLWQRRIDQPLRPFAAGQSFTVADTDGQGVVQVAFPPNTGPNDLLLRVCRLNAADGALLGCTDTPGGGRVGAMVVSSEPSSIWLWANEPLPGGDNQLSLIPLLSNTLGAPVYQQPGLQMRQTKSELVSIERSWIVVEPTTYAGVHGETFAPQTRVLMFQPGRVFGDGFEDDGTP